LLLKESQFYWWIWTLPKEKVLTVITNYRFNKCNEEEKVAIYKAPRVIEKSTHTLERWLSLLTLPEEIQEKVDSPITAKHIENVMEPKDIMLMKEVIHIIEKENLSSEQTKEVVEQITKRRRGRKKIVSEMTRKRGIVDDIDISIFLVRSLLWKEYGITQEELDNMGPKVVDKLLIYHRTKRELEEQEIIRQAKGK